MITSADVSTSSAPQSLSIVEQVSNGIQMLSETNASGSVGANEDLSLPVEKEKEQPSAETKSPEAVNQVIEFAEKAK